MQFIDPTKTVHALGVKSGDIVADLGVGSGAHAIAAAKIVGNNGKVYAVDIQKDLLETLHSMAKESGLPQLEIIWGDLDDACATKLSEEVVDRILISNTLFQLEDKNQIMHEAYRIAKPGAHMLVVDWSSSHGHAGPHPDNVVTQDSARNLAEGAGFVFSGTVPAGDFHYGLLFEKES